MLDNIIFLITAILGFITVLLIGIRYNSKNQTNLFLIVFLFLNILRFFIHGLAEILPIAKFQKSIDLIFITNALPLLYLYFGRLSKAHNHLKGKELLHFVLPSIFILYYYISKSLNNYAFTFGFKTGLMIAIIYSVVYYIASIKLLKNNVWERKSEILVINHQNTIIKKWTKLLFGLFTLMFIRYYVILLFNAKNAWYLNQHDYLWISALLWIILYLKILISPELLFGYDIFQNKINEYKKTAIIFDHIWNLNVNNMINMQDAILKKKIDNNIKNYIIDIEHVAINTDFFLIENFSINDLANKLNVPKSHTVYLFKYHSALSFSDFKKIIRIQKAILLIESGFLKTNTLESLATHTGFSSYSPFFKSFKSITGKSPKEYNKN